MRENSVDWLKGISIVGVFLIHLMAFMFTEKDVTVISLYVDSLFRFAVPFFFGILGYMTFTRYRYIESIKRFYFDKAIYLVLPFLCWSVIYQFVPVVYEFTERNEGQPILKAIFLGYSEIHLYFMVAYLTFVILTPLIVKGMKKVSLDVVSTICVWLTAIYVGILMMTEMNLGKSSSFFFSELDLRNVLRWVGYYTFGLFIGINFTKVKFLFSKLLALKKWKYGALVIVYLLSVFYFMISGKMIMPYLTPLLMLNSIIALALLLILFNRVQYLPQIKTVLWLGRHTFPIYLSHVCFLKIGFSYFCKDGINAINLLLTALVAIFLTLLYTQLHIYMINGVKKAQYSILQRINKDLGKDEMK